MSKVDKRISPEITSEARDETQYYNISNFDISTDIVFVTMPTKLCRRQKKKKKKKIDIYAKSMSSGGHLIKHVWSVYVYWGICGSTFTDARISVAYQHYVKEKYWQ